MNAEEHPILTREEAMILVKKSTPRSFGDWRRRHGVRPTGRNRFARKDLNLALKREAGEAHMPASLRGKNR